MSAITPHLIGRFGNQLFIYAHARALAERDGLELRTPEWVGEKIFQLDDPPSNGTERRIEGYRQSQSDLIYSRADCRRWFKFRPEVEARLAENILLLTTALAHQRRGDYLGAGYPVVSRQSYLLALEAKRPGGSLDFVTEEQPHLDPYFYWAPFLPDFYRMMRVGTLFRSNSSFSWWAATLGDATVYSPVIDGLEGGREHDNVPFVRGNHPRLANYEFTTDLHLREV